MSPIGPTRHADDDLLEHGPVVWRAIVRLLGADAADAADCFQQAFVEVAARRRRGGAIASPAALLKHVAVARAIDCVRRRVRERRRFGNVEVDRLAADVPSDASEAAELLADLRIALAGLPSPQSTAFVLTQIEGVPHDEAATAIGVTVNHLGVLLHRARATLRERLDSHKPIREAQS